MHCSVIFHLKFRVDLQKTVMHLHNMQVALYSIMALPHAQRKKIIIQHYVIKSRPTICNFGILDNLLSVGTSECHVGLVMPLYGLNQLFSV